MDRHSEGETRLIDYYICGRASEELMVAQHFLPQYVPFLSVCFRRKLSAGIMVHACSTLAQLCQNSSEKMHLKPGRGWGVLRFQPAALVSFDSLVARRVKNPATFMVVHFSGSTYLFS